MSAFAPRHGAGLRHLADHPAVGVLLRQPSLVSLIRDALSDSALLYKATLFDKHADANWLVTWHQDVLIPVAEEIVVPGFLGWCRKDGVCYVQPPVLMLAGLVALRINLDDCDDRNGPLRVLAGSHRLGRVEQTQIPVAVENHREEVITGERGDGVLMRPLLLHASSKASTDSRRRVLHLEFADGDLPGGLAWHRQLSLAGGTKESETS